MAHADGITPFLWSRVMDDDTIRSVDCGERMFGHGIKIQQQMKEYKAMYNFKLNFGGLPLTIATNPATNYGQWRNSSICNCYDNFGIAGDYLVELNKNASSAQFVIDNPVILKDLKNSNEYQKIQWYLTQHKKTIEMSLKNIGIGDMYEPKVNLNEAGSRINYDFGQLVYKNGSVKNLRVWDPYWPWRDKYKNLMRIYTGIVTLAVGDSDSKLIYHWCQIIPFLGTLHYILGNIFGVKMHKHKFVFEWQDWKKQDKTIYSQEYQRKLKNGDLVLIGDATIVEYWEVYGYFDRKNKCRPTSWVEYTCTADAPPSSDSESENVNDLVIN